jgi:cell division protein FtsB
MTQRRMPSGQGPSRGAARPPAPSGPRASSQRSTWRRADRIPRTDPPAHPSTVARAGPAQVRSEHRPGPRREKDRRVGIRRAAGPARRTRAPRRPRRISGRAAVLGALLVALAFAYAYPVRVYLEQQAQINALETAQQQQRQRIQGLTDSLARWNNDDYVIAEARTRFQLVRKGELLYMVVDPAAAQSGTEDRTAPWFDQLRSNLREIDNPPTDEVK